MYAVWLVIRSYDEPYEDSDRQVFGVYDSEAAANAIIADARRSDQERGVAVQSYPVEVLRENRHPRGPADHAPRARRLA